eukprot:scaffold74023_cov30-Prasinocladus_malaysianus.AAC.1
MSHKQRAPPQAADSLLVMGAPIVRDTWYTHTYTQTTNFHINHVRSCSCNEKSRLSPSRSFALGGRWALLMTA